MTLREKIEASKQERKSDGGLNKALWRMFLMIMGGYVVGTLIAILITKWRG